MQAVMNVAVKRRHKRTGAVVVVALFEFDMYAETLIKAEAERFYWRDYEWWAERLIKPIVVPDVN